MSEEASIVKSYFLSPRSGKVKIGSGANLAVKDIDLMLAEVAGFTALLQQIKAGAAQIAETRNKTKTTAREKT